MLLMTFVKTTHYTDKKLIKNPVTTINFITRYNLNLWFIAEILISVVYKIQQEKIGVDARSYSKVDQKKI